MKFKLRKVFLVSAVASLLAATNVWAEDIVYLNDGYIIFEGVAAKNDNVTVSITKEGYDLSDEAEMEYAKADDFFYFSNTTSDAKGAYAFKFKLKENGIYNLYIGGDKAKEIEAYKIEYTNKEANDIAIEILNEYVKNGTESDVASLLTDSKDNLRIYLGIYEQADMENVGSFVYDYLKENGEENDSDEVKKIIEKALLIDCLNSDKIDNLDEFVEIFGVDDTALSYYNQADSKQIQKMLEETEISTIEEFDERLKVAIIVSGINSSDGTGVIKNILTDYREIFDISKSDITSDLCSEIADNIAFDSLEDIKEFIKDYEPPKSGSDGGSSGGGSKGSGSNKAVSGNSIGPIDLTTNKQSLDNVRFFEDVTAEHWACEAIETLYKKNIISGKADSLFYPQDLVKREEFVKMLALSFGFDLVNEEIPFEDVKKDAWYYDYVRSAYLAYVVKGISETKFGSGMDITRQDLAVMIVNALKSSDNVLPEVEEAVVFTDEALISDYAKEAVLMLQKADVISGYDDGSFKPQGNATRAEAAKMLYNVLQYID